MHQALGRVWHLHTKVKPSRVLVQASWVWGHTKLSDEARGLLRRKEGP